MMNRSQRKAYYAILIAYIAVFLLPLLTGSIIYTATSRALSEEIVRANLLSLNQSCQVIENELDAVLNMGTALAQDRTLRRYLSISEEMTAEDRYPIKDIIDGFAVLSQGHEIVEESYIYGKNARGFISASTLMPADLFFAYQYHVEGVSVQESTEWLEAFNRFFEVQAITLQGAAKEVPAILIFQPIPKDSLSHVQGVLISVIRQQRLVGYLEDNNPSGQYMVLDGAGRVMTASEDLQYVLETDRLTGERGYYTDQAHPNRLVVSYEKLDSFGWYVVSILSESDFMAGLVGARRIFLLSYGICLVLGAVMVYLLSRRQYSPIQSILVNLRRSGIKHQSQSVYEYIHGSIDHILTEKSELEQKVEESVAERSRLIEWISGSRKQIQASLMISLMHGSIQNVGEAKSWFAFYGLDFPYDWYRAVVFSCEAEPENTGIVCALIQEELERDAFGPLEGYATKAEGSLIALVLNAQQEGTLAQTPARVQPVCEKISRQLKMSITFTCGQIHQDLGGLVSSFQEALQQRSREHAGALSRQAPRGEASRGIPEEEDIPVELILEAPEAAMVRIQRMLANEALSVDQKQFLMYKTSRQVVSLLHEYAAQGEEGELSQALQDLAFADDPHPESVARRFVQILRESLEALGQARQESEGREKSQAEQMRVFIEQHLTDPMLSQVMIADAFGLSRSSVSKIFKREFQMSMTDYINHARVVRSLPYLMDTAYSLSEVAEQVGFSNSHALIRVFKKHEHMTPGKYREENAGKTEDETP